MTVPASSLFPSANAPELFRTDVQHGTFREVATVGCQRWRDGRHSFLRRRDGGFDADRYEVHPLDEATAKAYVLTHHYSKTYPAAQHRFGLFLRADQLELVGVAVFSVPTQRAVLTNVFPDLDYGTACELGRLVLEGPPAHRGGHGIPGGVRAPANAESWFVTRCLHELAQRGVQGVVSFADPVPRRRDDGTVLLPGHVGTVYAACNFTYTGRGTARRIIVLPDGTTLNDRSVQKVRAQDRGHAYVEQRLIALGAAVPRTGENMTGWLRDALETIGAQRLAHRGNHRYAVTLGTTRTARRAVRMILPPLPHPKQPDC